MMRLKCKVSSVFIILFILVGISSCCFRGSNEEQEKREEQELCASVQLNIDGLKRDLQTKLYGQHLVTQAVLGTLRGHFSDPNPGKPLVLSFHGWTGGGKNFVASMIKDNTFDARSGKHYHLFNSEIHFKNKKHIDKYKNQLHSWIYHNVSKCARSMFVFDELDHMPMGVLNVLTPFLDHNDNVDGVDFRKSVFIFLSNSGGGEITKVVYEHWKKGKDRKSVRLTELQKQLELVAYNENGGLMRSKLVHKNLIDLFVPFMPLERGHVGTCVHKVVQDKFDFTPDHDMVNMILDRLVWQPEEDEVFSKSGCKKVESLVKQMVDKNGLIHDEL